MAIPSNPVSIGGWTRKSDYDALYNNAVLANTGGTAGGVQSIPGAKTWTGIATFNSDVRNLADTGMGTAGMVARAHIKPVASADANSLYLQNEYSSATYVNQNLIFGYHDTLIEDYTARIVARHKIAASYGTELRFQVHSPSSSVVMTNGLVIDASGNIGVLTTVPGQILDVNQGSGNMIADGYDSHPSFAALKDEIQEISEVLPKLVKFAPKSFLRKPYVSADELRIAIDWRFGELKMQQLYPDNDYYGGALWECPDVEVKQYIDLIADSLRAERKEQPFWQRRYIGLILDDQDTEVNAGDIILREEGEIKGYNNMAYTAMLHAGLRELAAKVTDMENRMG